MFNPFSKNKSGANAGKMGMLQKIAMKKLAKMSPQEQQKVMQEAMKPKNRDKMIAAMEQMKKSGQITEEQYKIAKQKMGM